MAVVQIPVDLFVAGALTPAALNPPNGCITNNAVQANAQVDASKVMARIVKSYEVVPGTAVAAATHLIHTVATTGSNVMLVNVITTAHPTSSDNVTIDLKAAAAGSTSFASILSAVVTLNSSTANNTIVSPTISSPTRTLGDTLELVITASGSSCTGLLVEVYIHENSQ